MVSPTHWNFPSDLQTYSPPPLHLMPKRSFNRRVLSVIRQDQETKRTVSTRTQCIKQPDLQVHPLVAKNDNTLDAAQNYWHRQAKSSLACSKCKILHVVTVYQILFLSE